MQRTIITLLFLGFFAQSSLAAYYDTLPKGIRALDLRYISTSKISSSFTGLKEEEDYNFKLNLDAKSLEGLNEEFQNVISYLRDISRPAYEAFSLGEYEFDADAQVSVRVVGMGYGLTNKTTIYAGVPIYNGQVNLDIQRTKGNNNAEVARHLQDAGISTDLTTFDANGELLQSVVVNYLGYKPIGNWQAQGLGDIEVGFIHRLKSWRNYGIGISGGVVLPTGREDDPDIIQDIPFGDGQTDVFAEIGGGYQSLDLPFSFDTFFRYTYQLPHYRTMRVAEDENYKEIAQTKDEFYEQLGSIYDYTFLGSFNPAHWLSFNSGITYNYQEASSYKSKNAKANEVLAKNTEKESFQLRGGVGISTVSSFKSGDFLLPMTANLGVRHVISGRNNPRYTRFDLELRFFF